MGHSSCTVLHRKYCECGPKTKLCCIICVCSSLPRTPQSRTPYRSDKITSPVMAWHGTMITPPDSPARTALQGADALLEVDANSGAQTDETDKAGETAHTVCEECEEDIATHYCTSTLRGMTTRRRAHHPSVLLSGCFPLPCVQPSHTRRYFIASAQKKRVTTTQRNKTDNMVLNNCVQAWSVRSISAPTALGTAKARRKRTRSARWRSTA